MLRSVLVGTTSKVEQTQLDFQVAKALNGDAAPSSAHATPHQHSLASPVAAGGAIPSPSRPVSSRTASAPLSPQPASTSRPSVGRSSSDGNPSDYSAGASHG